MTDKELRHMSRSQLLEMLIVQMEENEKLKNSLEKAHIMLTNRQIMIDRAGSLAEAALQLNGVFEAADQAAQQYLENIRRMTEEGTDDTI